MAIRNPLEPQLDPVPLKMLRPTQMTVGFREVELKRTSWRKRVKKDGPDFLGEHMIPVVTGPGGVYWIVDHHHLARALMDEGVAHVLVSVIAKLKHLDERTFFTFLDNRNWIHVYDNKGKRCDLEDLPRSLAGMKDDPYRSLASEIRRRGCCSKVETPYAEFLWADFLRTRIKPSDIRADYARSVKRAMKLARSQDAAYLPGFSGPEED